MVFFGGGWWWAEVICEFFILLTYLFSVALDLRCFAWAFSSCSTQASPCSGFSCCRAQTRGHVGFSSCGSQALGHRLSRCGAGALAALRHVGSSWTRYRTRVSYIGRQILYHWPPGKPCHVLWGPLPPLASPNLSTHQAHTCTQTHTCIYSYAHVGRHMLRSFSRSTEDHRGAITHTCSLVLTLVYNTKRESSS